jgi:hypothetical protein
MREEVKRVRNVLMLLWIAATCSGVFLSCSQDPSEANSLVASLPFTGFTTRDTVLTASTSKFERIYAAMEGNLNLVGRNGTYEAYSILQFYPSTFPIRDTISVLSATLTVRFVTWYGTAGALLEFTVYRVTRGWSSSTVKWDSVQTGFYESTPRGTFNISAAPDSFDAVIPLDTAMVREWFSSNTSTTESKYGLILVPNTTTQNSVRGMYSFGAGDTTVHSPKLIVIAANAAGTTRDTSTFTFGQDTFVGTDDHSGADPNLLFVESGVNFRAALTFDVSQIPRGAILNRADLLMEQDPASSRISIFAGDTAIATHALLTDSSLSSNFSFEDAASLGRHVPGKATSFSFDIRTIAQSWIRGPNYGVLLRFPAAQEFSSADLISFYGATVQDTLRRPRLKITYSTPVK